MEFQITSSGVGAIMVKASLETGCVKLSFRAWRWIPPSGLLRSKPYFKSPLMGEPIADNCALIWWCLPVWS